MSQDSTTKVCLLKTVELRIHECNSNYAISLWLLVHHDFSWHETERQQGPRILTIFLYLNDPEEGGETDFPNINITVTPRRGRVVLWVSRLKVTKNRGLKFSCVGLTLACLFSSFALVLKPQPSVFDDEPEEMDLRTEHQSLPVTKGVKYGANLWFHQRNFTHSSANDCTW